MYDLDNFFFSFFMSDFDINLFLVQNSLQWIKQKRIF